MVLFKSPSDRKQIDIITERIFAKDRPNFMSVYGYVTAKPYGYVMIDNQPKTTSEKQVVSDVLGQCQSYPHISKHANAEVSRATPEMNEQSKQSVKKEPVKRSVELPTPRAKKSRKQQSKQAKKQSKATNWVPFT